MTEITLDATLREGKGKSAAKRLRSEGIVPGVIYGQKEPVSIQVNGREAGRLVHQFHGSERLVGLNLKDDKGQTETRRVLLKEVQTTAVGQNLIHIDFQEVDVTKTVQVSVEVRSKGKAVGEKFGGILQTVTHEIVVECLPTGIPEFIELDVSALEIGHSLHVGDVALPEGVKAISSAEDTIFVVAAPAVEKELTAEEMEAAAAAIAAPEAEAAEEAEG